MNYAEDVGLAGLHFTAVASVVYHIKLLACQ